MLRGKIGLERLLAPAILFVALSTVGAKWLVFFRAAGVTVELSNFGTLVVIGLAAVLVATRSTLRAPLVLNVLFTLLIALLFSLSVRGDGIGIVLMSIAGTLGAYALANLNSVRAPNVVLWSFAAFVTFLALSIAASGVDFLGGVIEFLTGRDRGRFFYRVLRPVYNAFSTDGSDLERTATLNNAVAATFTLFFILSGSFALNGKRRMMVIAVISLLSVFLLFSSSSVLACILVSSIFTLCWLRKSPRPWQVYAFLLLCFLLLLLIGPTVAEYISFSFGEDSASRESRLDQYFAALDSIDSNILFGAGYVEVNGRPIHNFFLFSFAAAGVAGAIASGFVLLSAVWLSGLGLRAIFLGAGGQPDAVMCACLPILFLIRCMVAGGGGLPAGAGILALSMAIVARRNIAIRLEGRSGAVYRDPDGLSTDPVSRAPRFTETSRMGY